MPTVDANFSHIAGNVSDDVKRALGFPEKYFTDADSSASLAFGEAIHRRLNVTEISVHGKIEEPLKLEAKVVIETVVADGKSKSTRVVIDRLFHNTLVHQIC